MPYTIKQTGTDAAEVTLHGMISAIDLRDLVEKQYRQMELRRYTLVAVIPPAVGGELASAYVEVSRKYGWNAMGFRDRTSALEWLATTVAAD